jgi:hypothetical protein
MTWYFIVEIKYIDETTDDEFDNKEDQTLLEKPEVVNNDNEITSPKHSTVIEHNCHNAFEANKHYLIYCPANVFLLPMIGITVFLNVHSQQCAVTLNKRQN